MLSVWILPATNPGNAPAEFATLVDKYVPIEQESIKNMGRNWMPRLESVFAPKE